MQYLAYDKYVITDIDWLNQIPSHWQVLKGKFIGQIATTPSLTDEELTSDETSLCYIKVSELNVNGNIPFFSKGSLFAIDESISHTKNSIIFPKRGEAIFTNKASILKIGALLDPNLMSWELEPNNDLKFFYYALLARRLDDIADTSTVPQINNKHIMPMFFPYPELPEQRKIAKFLDYKTQHIDLLIEKKKALIERLEEKRIAVITQAVTKGIDDKAKFKPSGVDWIGDVPMNWNVVKFKYFIGYQEGPGIMAVDFKDEGVPLLRIRNVKSETISMIGCNFLDPDKVQKTWDHFRCNGGDLIISGSASTGLVSEVQGDAIGSIVYTGLIRLWPYNGQIIKEYIRLLVASNLFSNQIDQLKTGSTIQHFGPEHLKQILITLPPIEEQIKIVTISKSNLSNINKLIKKAQQVIERIEEYRSAIITSAVTGKIDVREIEIPEVNL